ncbi:MAG: radical SAM protein [Bacteroidetes bacterium]|nr:radical SAM protein [Bacteroidota bacterium]
MISFGPIPSRRLGKSLGINNIPAQKICSYSCIYCQVGITKKYSLVREEFFDPMVIYKEVKAHLEKLNEEDLPDYLTFVANGEPTLDIHLGEAIKKLKTLNIPIAVITNASMLCNKQVRDEISFADLVSVKIDSVEEESWKAVNLPISDIDFHDLLTGLLKFSREYSGKLISETMLVQGVNDASDILHKTSEFVSQVNPAIAYISIPTRPPAISTVSASSEDKINEAYQIFSGKNLKVELLLGFEGTNMGHTGNAIADILNICTVHPIREDTMLELLKKDNARIAVLDSLIYDQLIKKVTFDSNTFYLRRFHV